MGFHAYELLQEYHVTLIIYPNGLQVILKNWKNNSTYKISAKNFQWKVSPFENESKLDVHSRIRLKWYFLVMYCTVQYVILIYIWLTYAEKCHAHEC